MVSHLDKKNNPIMVNVGNKIITKRFAEAQGEVVFDKITFKKIEKLKSKKGSIKNIAIVAGIMGAKETSRLIPLCHNIPIDSVNVEIEKNTTLRTTTSKAKIKICSFSDHALPRALQNGCFSKSSYFAAGVECR